MLEVTRLFLFVATLAGAAACVAMQLGRLALSPWLTVVAYALPVVVVLLIGVAGLRAPRLKTPAKVPLVLKAIVAGVIAYAAFHVVIHLHHGGGVSLGAAWDGMDGRRAVTSLILVGYAVAFAIAWRRVPKRPARL